MPSGSSASPWGIPGGFIGIGFAFPECEVAGIFFGFIDIDADAVEHFIEISVREFAVIFESGDSVIDVAAGFVGIAVIKKFLYESDDIGDVLSDSGFDISFIDVNGGHICMECIDHACGKFLW